MEVAAGELWNRNATALWGGADDLSSEAPSQPGHVKTQAIVAEPGEDVKLLLYDGLRDAASQSGYRSCYCEVYRSLPLDLLT